jgi:hypothetical protein
MYKEQAMDDGRDVLISMFWRLGPGSTGLDDTKLGA